MAAAKPAGADDHRHARPTRRQRRRPRRRRSRSPTRPGSRSSARSTAPRSRCARARRPTRRWRRDSTPSQVDRVLGDDGERPDDASRGRSFRPRRSSVRTRHDRPARRRRRSPTPTRSRASGSSARSTPRRSRRAPRAASATAVSPRGSHAFQVEAQVGINPPSAPVPILLDDRPDRADDHGRRSRSPVARTTTPVGRRDARRSGSAAPPTDPSGVGERRRRRATAVDREVLERFGVLVGRRRCSTRRAARRLGTTRWSGRPTARTRLSVRATDGFGNTTASNGDVNKRRSRSTPPRPPRRCSCRSRRTRPPTRRPQFDFTDTSAPATFTCRLDGGCGNRLHGGQSDTGARATAQYGGLATGSHCFAVFATDAAFNVGPTTTYCWTITAPNRRRRSRRLGLAAGRDASTRTSGRRSLRRSPPRPTTRSRTRRSRSPPRASGASGTFASPCSGTTLRRHDEHEWARDRTDVQGQRHRPGATR